MFPVELHLGPFALNPHGVMTAVGIWMGWVLARVEARRKNLDQAFLDNLALAVVLGGLVGARLSFVLFENLDALLRDPWSALRLWEGGVALQGGILGGLVVGLWYCRRHGIAAGPYADAVVPGLLLGQALGRFGDFLVGGEYGIETAMPWAVTFTDPRAQAPLGVPLHPTQLYEMAWDLAVLGILWPRRADALAYRVLGQPFPAARTISLLTMLACLIVHARLRHGGIASRPETPAASQASQP